MPWRLTLPDWPPIGREQTISGCRSTRRAATGPQAHLSHVRRQRTVEPIAEAIIGADGGKCPVRAAIVERKIRELCELEPARRVGTPDDTARRLAPEIGHHRHAAAVAAKRTVHAVERPSVWQ